MMRKITPNAGLSTSSSAPITLALGLALIMIVLPAGGIGAEDEPVPSIMESVPIEGKSYAAWHVRHAGGPLTYGVEGQSELAPDAGALALVRASVSAKDGHVGGSAFTLVWDTGTDHLHAASNVGEIDLQMTKYEGPSGASVLWRSTSTSTNFPAGDWYMVAIVAQDTDFAYSGELQFFLEGDAEIIASDYGDAFYYRDRDYPAAVNVAYDEPGGLRSRHIELGVVEKEITGKLFTYFGHTQPSPAPVWFPHAWGFWVEGPGIDGPVDGAVNNLWMLGEPCEDPGPYPCILWNISPYVYDGIMAGQNGGTYLIGAGEPGTYRFRVDHWNVVHHPLWPWHSPMPNIGLVGADYDL